MLLVTLVILFGMVLLAIIVGSAIEKTDNALGCEGRLFEFILLGLFFAFIISCYRSCDDFEREEKERKERMDKAVDEIRKTKEWYQQVKRETEKEYGK